MEELERLSEASDKVTDFQRKYNVNQKNVAYLVGKNLTLFICMLVPLLLVGFVWTDFLPIVVGPKMFGDGVLTVLLFTVGEIMMMRLGADGGKLDEEYLEAKIVFNNLLNEVFEVGTLLMGVYCDWQVDVELEQAVQFRRRMLRMSPRVWEEAKGKTYEELKELYGRSKAKKIIKIIELQPIELNEAILLYDGEYSARGGVPISGEDFLRSKKNIIELVLACLFTGLLTVTVVVTLTKDITFARVIYTLFKLLMLLFRMAKGYDKGAKAYNTIEVRQLKAKSNYLRQYIKFVNDKIYLKLGDKYGDISQFVGETPTETPTTNEE